MAKPYLSRHPEREIAAATTVVGVAYCPACDITYRAPASFGPLEYAARYADSRFFAYRHNAERHPRRAHRLTQ